MGDAKPFCVNTPRSIPFAYREKLKTELEFPQDQGIIAPVTVPTEWCAPIVIEPKKDSDNIRMCVDLSRLNRYIKRERYLSSNPAQAVADITADNAKAFTKLDALKGYHQCPLDEESQLLTTFITPLGIFKYLRAPYGISSISEHYNRRMDEAFAGLSGYHRIVDDMVIYDSDITQHASHIKEFLQRCAEGKITLNQAKWTFAQPQVTFAGFILSADGYKVDSSITDAISRFPTPSNRTNLLSFFGLVNQLSASTSSVAGLLAPLRPLLSAKNEFVWAPEQNQAFDNAKKSLTTAPTLAFFDVSKPMRLCTDASRQGLGFILQQNVEDRWVLIQAGSRFLTDPESRYAVIELELLAVVWAMSKCNIFLAGSPHFTVMTDHHPLIPILNSHRLDEIENPHDGVQLHNRMGQRCTKLCTRCIVPEPVFDPQPNEALGEKDVHHNPECSIAEIRAMNSGDYEIQDLRRHTDTDDKYQQLKGCIIKGFPDPRSQLPEAMKRYWNARDQLTLDNRQ